MRVMPLRMVRGDSATFEFAYDGETPTGLRFYVRQEVDGPALVALTLAAQPDQFALGDGTIGVTLLPEDTDGQPACTAQPWVYDLEVTTAAGVATIQGGTFWLLGDVATDAVDSSITAPLMGVTAAQRAALDAADAPGGTNALVTASALAEELTGYAPASHQHGGTDITSAVASAVDADTVDGSHASAFATVSHQHIGDREFIWVAEFAGAVLAADGSGNVGTLTAGYDDVGRRNYYDWTTSEATTQCYDVVVQFRLPPGFVSWRAGQASVLVMSRVSAAGGATGVRVVELLDASGVNRITPGTQQRADWTEDAWPIAGGTWSAGDLVTLRVRLLADAGEHAQLHAVRLPWTGS